MHVFNNIIFLMCFCLFSVRIYCEDIFEAVAKNNLELTKKFIESGADLNQTDKYGDNVLIAASYKGAPALIDYLIAKGADLNAVNDYGNNAFISAYRSNNSVLVEHFKIKYSNQLKYDVISKSYKVNGVEKTIDVLYEKANPESAEKVLEKTIHYIQIAGEYLDSPIGENRLIISLQRAKDPKAISYQIGNTVILLYKNLQNNNYSLLFHELGHFWTAYDGSEWCFEGLASMLPAAIREYGLGDEKIIPLKDLYDYWRFDYTGFKTDYPLEKDFRFEPDGLFLYYAKIFKVQYLIYKELGRDKYHQWAKTVLTDYTSVIGGDDALVKTLNKIKISDWHKFLSGWVFKGDYLIFNWDDFSDLDRDGIIGVDEHYLKLNKNNPDTDNDGIIDGVELESGLDPSRIDNKNDLKKVILAKGPFIDGRGNEWEYFEVKTAADDPDDSTGGKDYDLLKLEYFTAKDLLFIKIITQKKLPGTNGVFFDLMLDVNADGKYDGDIGFNLDKPQYAWRYYHSSNKSYKPEGLISAMDECIELAIPLKLFGNEVNIIPILKNRTKGEIMDKFKGWINIRLK